MSAGPSRSLPAWMLPRTETIATPPLEGWYTRALDLFRDMDEYISPAGHHYYVAEIADTCECCGQPRPLQWIVGRWDWNDSSRTMRKIATAGSLMEALEYISDYERSGDERH